MISLAEFLYDFGINTTSNFDLKDISRILEIKIKILMKNELNELDINKINKPLIINLQNTNENGSHWVLFYNFAYFDSYRIQPIKEIEYFVKVYNTIQIQPNNSKMCGQLCLYICYHLINRTFQNYEDLILNTYDEMLDLLSLSN